MILKLTHYDKEVFIMLNSVTYIEKTKDNLGQPAMAVHFVNKRSIIVDESFEDIEKMLQRVSSKMYPPRKTHLGFDYR
tara:strand:- start:31 stop:264 length:234 start_codon:yes stop_codon:yes gene_type:complete